jgi:hypothetical protein
MKRILSVIGLVSMLACAGAVVAHAADEKAATSGSPAMAKNAALKDKLEALERKVWDAFKAQDLAAAKQVISPEASSIDMSGFATFAQFEPMMKDYAVDSYTLSDFNLLVLDKDAAVLTFSATQNAKYKGEPIPSGPYYCSTTYVSRAGKWFAMFHTETLAMSAMMASGGEKK